MIRRIAYIVLIAALMVLLGVVALAGQIRIDCDPVTGAAGWNIYYGTQSRVYMASVQTLSMPSTVIVPLDNQTVYTAVKAYNTVGEASDYSRELAGWPYAEVTHIDRSCTVLEDGDVSCLLEITGSNFAPAMQAQLPYPGVTIDNAARISATRFDMLITIAADAAGGTAELELRNPWIVVEGTRPPTGDDGNPGGNAGIIPTGTVTITPIILPATSGNYVLMDAAP